LRITSRLLSIELHDRGGFSQPDDVARRGVAMRRYADAAAKLLPNLRVHSPLGPARARRDASLKSTGTPLRFSPGLAGKLPAIPTIQNAWATTSERNS